MNNNICIWLYGLSGSGKTSIGQQLHAILKNTGNSILLDGDTLRNGINKDLGYGTADRTENIRRVAEINKLFLSQGITTINCIITPLQAHRQMAEEIIGTDKLLSIFIDTDIEDCIKRDPKGLYKKAQEGIIKDFTGISSPFERPNNNSISIRTKDKTIAMCLQEVLSHINTKKAMLY